jgi:hypothetical protein
MNDTPAPSRPNVTRKSLTRILIVLACLAACGVVVMTIQPPRWARQRQARLKLNKSGGTACYEYQLALGGRPPFPSPMWDVVGDCIADIVYATSVKGDDAAQIIGAFPKLKYLSLEGPQVTDATLECPKDCPELEWLGIVDTQVTPLGLKQLEKLPQLRGMNLIGTNVTDDWLECLSSMKQFRQFQSLAIYHAGVTDRGLRFLAACPHLTILFLDSPNVTDAGLDNVARLTKLTGLELNNANITDAGVERIRRLTKLRSLHLKKTKITDAGLRFLVGMSDLRHLDLNATSITDAGLECLKGLRQLEHLDIDDTKVTRRGVEKFKKALPNCSVYDNNLYYGAWQKEP